MTGDNGNSADPVSGIGTFRVAVAGFGNIGPVHAAAISSIPGMELAAVCDPDPECLALAGTAYPGVRKYSAYDDLLEDRDIDAIHVCTPHWMHARMAMAALIAGKHVLLEKPMALDEAEARELADTISALKAERGKGTPLFGLCFQNRYRPALAEAARVIHSGRYGKFMGARITVAWKRDAAYYASRGGWRGKWSTEGGGALINQAIHSLDILRWIGGEISGMRSAGMNMTLSGVIEVEDTALLFLDFASGGRGILFATNGYVEDAPVDYEFLCEGAKLRVHDALCIMENGSTFPTRATILAQDPGPAADSRHAYWGNWHGSLIADFYECIRKGKAFPLDAESGLGIMKLLDRFYKDTGRPGRRALTGEDNGQ